MNATCGRWLRVLDTYASRTWTVDEVSLIESQLRGRGHRPRHVEISIDHERVYVSPEVPHRVSEVV